MPAKTADNVVGKARPATEALLPNHTGRPQSARSSSAEAGTSSRPRWTGSPESKIPDWRHHLLERLGSAFQVLDKLARERNADLVAARFKVFNVSIKPHASCRHTHAAIDATLGLLSSAVRGGIERVEIETYEAALALCDNPSPKTPYEAKFSLQYCVALALSRGHVGLGDFAEEVIADPEIRELLPAIALSSNPQFEELYPEEWPVRVHIRLKTGETLSASVRHPKGDPEQPLSARELRRSYASSRRTAATRWRPMRSSIGSRGSPRRKPSATRRRPFRRRGPELCDETFLSTLPSEDTRGMDDGISPS